MKTMLIIDIITFGNEVYWNTCCPLVRLPQSNNCTVNSAEVPTFPVNGATEPKKIMTFHGALGGTTHCIFGDGEQIQALEIESVRVSGAWLTDYV